MRNQRKAIESPEHNKMQGYFLDDDFCLKFYELAYPFELKEHKERMYTEVVNKRKIQVVLENPTGEKDIWGKDFEKNGIDVSYCLAIEFEQVKESWDLDTLRTCHDDFNTTFFTKALKIEIVPEVSDDYPSVLRQMQKLKANCLYLENYTGKGIDEEKFIKMFNHQGIDVVFERQLI